MMEDRAFAASVAQIDPIMRIADYLAGETDALRRFAPCDLTRGNGIKAQALLELTRHARTLRGIVDKSADNKSAADRSVDNRSADNKGALRAALETLRARIVENQSAVALHLEAARTLNAVIVAAVERDGSDRTYSRVNRSRRPS